MYPLKTLLIWKVLNEMNMNKHSEQLSDYEIYSDLFAALDEIDRSRVIARMQTLLEADKYSAKRKIVWKNNNVISVDFRKK